MSTTTWIKIQTPYMFFKNNGGFSYDPKTETEEQGKRRSALAHARAEVKAKKLGIRFEWDPDYAGCIGCDCKDPACECSSGEAHSTEFCYAYVLRPIVLKGIDMEGIVEPADARVVLASLSGICCATDQYRRVVEAELAIEAIGRLGKEGE